MQRGHTPVSVTLRLLSGVRIRGTAIWNAQVERAVKSPAHGAAAAGGHNPRQDQNQA